MNAEIRRTLVIVLAGFVICITLVAASALWPEPFMLRGFAAYLPGAHNSPPIYPLLDLVKLLVAGLLGLVVTGVLRFFYRPSTPSRSLEQCQVLLCIAGAFVMIIVGDSLARAFGVVGAAGVVRFRTPVENPRDSAVLFLLIGIGMACGLNAFGLAALMTLLVSVALGVLDYLARHHPRPIVLEVTAEGPELPQADIQQVLAERGVSYESRGVTRSKKNNTTATYVIHLPQGIAVEEINQALVDRVSQPIRSVSWYSPRRRSD
jgi:hypothetical protein